MGRRCPRLLGWVTGDRSGQARAIFHLAALLGNSVSGHCGNPPSWLRGPCETPPRGPLASLRGDGQGEEERASPSVLSHRCSGRQANKGGVHPRTAHLGPLLLVQLAEKRVLGSHCPRAGGGALGQSPPCAPSAGCFLPLQSRCGGQRAHFTWQLAPCSDRVRCVKVSCSQVTPPPCSCSGPRGPGAGGAGQHHLPV